MKLCVAQTKPVTGDIQLSEIAKQHHMAVLLANCVGIADRAECAGQSAVWNCEGDLVGQLDGKSEGILVFDTDTQEIIKEIV